MPRTFAEFAVGDTFEHGTRDVGAAEIREFAERYDPQSIHVDPEAAAASMYGGLIASGWHTAAMTMRLLVDDLLSETAALGAKGVDELRWDAPVRPGDRLRSRTEIVETVPETADRGLVHARTTTAVADAADPDDARVGEDVFSMVGLVMVARD